MEWYQIFGIAAAVGATLTEIGRRLIYRRRERATDSTAEATAYAAWQKAAYDAGVEMEKARQNSETWYAALQAVRKEADTKVDAATAELKTQNQELIEAVGLMAGQIDQLQVVILERDKAIRDRDKAILERDIAILERDEARRLHAEDSEKNNARIIALEEKIGTLEAQVQQLQAQLDEAQHTDRSTV